MKTSAAIRYYRSKALLAKALGIAPPSIYDWGDYPPPLRQLQIEHQTGGKLKAESTILPRRPKGISRERLPSS